MSTASPILRAFARLSAVLMMAAALTACGGDKDDDAAAPQPQLRCAP